MHEESNHAEGESVLTDLATCKQAHHFILGSVGVLELIHQDVLVALLHTCAHFWALLQQGNRPAQQIIKVQASAVQLSSAWGFVHLLIILAMTSLHVLGACQVRHASSVRSHQQKGIQQWTGVCHLLYSGLL